MVWTILARMDGVDTDGSVWYDAGQNWATANDISDGSAPEAAVTREQLATMLFRFAQHKGMAAVTLAEHIYGYPDADSVSGYAIPALNWAIGAGIINGLDGALAPQDGATRAQLATMLMRFDTMR